MLYQRSQISKDSKFLTWSISGAFPLSIITFMTDADRQQYSPVVKTLINLLEKEFLDPSEMNTLLEQSGNLTILIPENLIFQIYNGFNGLN